MDFSTFKSVRRASVILTTEKTNTKNCATFNKC